MLIERVEERLGRLLEGDAVFFEIRQGFSAAPFKINPLKVERDVHKHTILERIYDVNKKGRSYGRSA